MAVTGPRTPGGIEPLGPRVLSGMSAAEVKLTYTVTADNPQIGAPAIRAMLTAQDAEREVARLRQSGCLNIKVTPTRDPAGNAG